MSLDTLPDSILITILSFLDFPSSLPLSLVSSPLSFFISRSYPLWKKWWDAHSWLLERGEGKETIIEGRKVVLSESGAMMKENDNVWKENCRNRYKTEISQIMVKFQPSFMHEHKSLLISENRIECEKDFFIDSDRILTNVPFDSFHFDCSERKYNFKFLNFCTYFQRFAYFEIHYKDATFTQYPDTCTVMSEVGSFIARNYTPKLGDIFSVHIDHNLNKIIFKRNKEVLGVAYFDPKEKRGFQLNINVGTKLKLIKSKFIK